MKTRLILIALTCLPAMACSYKDSKPVDHSFSIGSEGAVPNPNAEAPADESGSGKVLETMNSGGYSYVKLDLGGRQVWVAGKETAVKVGDVVSYGGGTPMVNFHSKTLNRTFDVVYFAAGFQVGDKPVAAAPAPAPMMGNPMANPTAAPHTGAPVPVDANVKGVKKAEGGKTVAETFAAGPKMVGKEVVIRGKVVKFNANIMGRNWIHIQDGSGKDGTNDLTITTNDTASVGNTVLVHGTVATDKDFGAGYKYSVMLENAKITVE